MKKTTIFIILSITLGAIGVSYAAWSRHLLLNTSLSSGSLDIVFDESRPYYAEIIHANGTSINSGDQQAIPCTLDKEKKLATLSFDSTLLLNDLMDSNRFLIFQYPLALGERSTVQSVTPYMADLDLTSDEILQSIPSNPILLIGEDEYPLPENLQDAYAPLTWEIYRQMEMEDEQITGTVFLKLSNESKEDLLEPGELILDADELPEEIIDLITPHEDGSSGLLEAEIAVTYSFSIPLYIEQGHP